MILEFPVEVLEKIFELLSLKDLRTLRLTCKCFAHIAFRLAERTVTYPIAQLPLLWGISQIPETEELRRAYVIEKLADLEKACKIRTMTLTGQLSRVANHQDARYDHHSRQKLIMLRVKALSHLMLNAHRLSCLNIATDWTVSLPILRKICQFRNLRTLSLQLSPHDVDQTALPELPSLRHLDLAANWHRDEMNYTMSERIDFDGLRNVAELTLRGYAPSQFLDAFKGSTSSIQRCVVQDLVIGENGTHFFRRILDGLISLTFIKAEFEARIEAVFHRLLGLKIVDVCGFSQFQRLACPGLSHFTYSRTKQTQDLSAIAETIIPEVAKTLRVLELITSPYAHTHILTKGAITKLLWCQKLQYVLFDGQIYLTEEGLEVFDKSWTEIDMFMILQPLNVVGTGHLDMNYVARGSAGPPKYHVRIFQHLRQQIDTCPCGFRSRQAFSRLADPHQLMVGDGELDRKLQCSCPIS